MSTYCTNNPSRFSGCYASHDPTASQAPPTTTPVVPPSGGYYDYGGRRRTPEDIRRDRERFGVIEPAVARIIEDVAARQAEDLRQDEQQRFEELAGELRLAGIEYQSTYLALLNDSRQARIDTEIGRRITELNEENERRILLLVAIL